VKCLGDWGIGFNGDDVFRHDVFECGDEHIKLLSDVV
jgi:hypothetical protein